MMNGGDIKKAVINKGKQMASVASAAANGNGSKKRRKGTDLKPIVTNENNMAVDSNSGSNSSQGYFYLSVIFLINSSDYV
jgi:serine/threonine-protein kinase SRPK3